MLAALHVTPRLQVTPLLAFHYRTFEQCYLNGLCWSLFNEPSTNLMSDHALIENLQSILANTSTDERRSDNLPSIGFSFGRLHGAALSPRTGQLRAGVTTLVDFQHADATNGYGVGREWYFTEAHPDEQVCTDTKLMERLRELQHESIVFRDEEATWYYAIGYIVGELSGQLFAATAQEYAQWEKKRQQWLVEYDHR